jgi:hypothetical protein
LRLLKLRKARQIILRDPGRAVGFVDNSLQRLDLAKLRAVQLLV